MSKLFTRRRFLIGGTLGASALTLSGCDLLDQNADVAKVLRSAEHLTIKAQRLLQGRDSLAREFDEKDISPPSVSMERVLPTAMNMRSCWKASSQTGD